jgi:hypothetical protein
MNRITSQTSIQAADLIRDASESEDKEITVSWSGDVREANALERIIYGIVDFFDAGAPGRRRNEAREAVKTKLTNELAILAGPISRRREAILSHAIDTTTDNLISTGNINFNNVHDSLRTAFQNIRDIDDTSLNLPLKLIWKAVTEQRKENKQISIDAAKNIAQNTKIWKESLNISTRDALRLASNAWKLYESKEILPEDGKEILLCAGRLSSQHGFSHTDALNYAIDLRAPLKTLRLGLDSVERVMKSLDYAIPELRKQPERLRISAAIRYLQLQDTKHMNVKPIEEIRRSLTDLPLLQQAMPKGCVIDQIHQGAHIRGLSKHSFPEPSPNIDNENSLTAPEQALTDSANSLMSAKPQVSTREKVHGVSLPEVFTNFYKLHVEDLVRGNRFELQADNQIDTKFSQIEEERRKNPKTFSTNQYQQWAENRIRWADSERTVQIISGLESQSLFADVAVFSRTQFQNKDRYSVSASGENNLAQTSFQANRLTGTNQFIDEFILRETRYDNATRLLADPTDVNDRSDELLPRPQLEIPLIPNPGENIKAGAGGFSVKRSVGLSLSAPKLSASPPTCRITEVSEEWDLMVDWDQWMSMRKEIGTL